MSKDTSEDAAALQRQLDEQQQRYSRLEQVLLVARTGTFELDARTRILKWNQAGCELHGFDFEAMGQGIHYKELLSRVTSESVANLRAEGLSAQRDETTYEVHYEVCWPDGSRHWIFARGVWEFDDRHHPVAVFGICMKADSSHEYRRQLQASEQRLKEAQAAGQTGSWDLDIASGMMTVSQEYRRLHGISSGELAMTELLANIPESDHHIVNTAFEAACQQGGEYDAIHRVVHHETNDVRWMHGKGRGIFDGEGKLLRVAGTTRDVTEQRRAEAAFLETARTLQTLTQASPALVFRADDQGAATFFNEDRWLALSGLARGSWLGQGWFDAFHPNDRDRARQSWLAMVKTGQPFQDEFRWRHASGEVRWILFHALPVDRFVESSSYVGTGTDITALKSSERERATLQLALAESQKLEAIGTLASGVAHDFNNLLSAVRGYVELAASKLDGNADVTRYLEQAQVAVDQAKHVTSGLLTFARAGGPQQTAICLNTLVQKNAELLRQLVPASIDIVTEIPDQEIWIHGDDTQLQQVLTNLVINGRDALPDGGQVRVTLGFAGEDTAILNVRDNGVGMTAQGLERAFEPFYTTKEQGQGTGLGLSVVHGIVGSHHGEISLTSQPGQGTEVEVRLPITEISPVRSLPVVSRSVPRSRQRVLFVEDNPLVRESCALRMEAGGYEVVAVEDGEAALSVVREAVEPFTIAILDVDLPGASGVKVAEKLRTVKPGMSVLYVTGNLQNAALQQAGKDDPVLAKPLDYELLFDTIEAVAGRERSGQGG